MLREQSKLILVFHKLLDICLTALAFISAFFIKKYLLPDPYQGLSTGPDYYIVLLMVIIIWYLCFNFFDLYVSYRKKTFGKIFRNMVKAVSAGMVLLTLFMYLFKIKDISRIMMGTFFLLNIGLLCFSKGFSYKILSRYRQKGFNFRNILIVGSREGAKEVIDAIGDRLDAGFRVLGCLELEKDEIGKNVKNGVQVIETVDAMEKIIKEQVVDELIFAMPIKMIDNVEKYIVFAEDTGVSIHILPQWQIRMMGYEPKIGTLQFEWFLGLPTLSLTTTPNKHNELFIKSTLDYTVAAFALVLCLPLFVFAAAAIKLTSKGPVFFKQERLGLNGRKFMLYKFRTMAADAEVRLQEVNHLNESDGPVFKIKKDPRIIPFIGTLLRKPCIDELPQLINVLKGELSLVGPRPPIPDEVEKYYVWQRRRLSMKPGITCIWQTSPKRNEVSFKEWMNMDLSYIDNWSLGYDFKILFKTIFVVLTGAGR